MEPPQQPKVLTAGGVLGNVPSSNRKNRKNRKKDVVNGTAARPYNDTPPPRESGDSSSSSSSGGGVKSVRLSHERPGDGGDLENMDVRDDDKQIFSDEESFDDDEEDRPLTPEDLYNSLPLDSQERQLASPKSASSGSFEGSGATKTRASDIFWLCFCFFGIMVSFVVYGLLLEYTTSGGRHLHELSFLFVTSALYTVTAAAGRYVRDETPTTIPPARFALLGLTSMGSTFCSVRSLRYVIYPIQVLAKSCKPVPVMLMGALMGKKYPLKKYFNVVLIVLGVALFMGGGGKSGKKSVDASSLEESSSPSQMIGIALLFISLCFDGGTGAYEDKLMAVHSVGPFDLMYNIQLGKTILAGVALLVLNQVHVFMQMCQDMGFLLVALGLSGAMGQVFIFVTISKFGALTCSIIGLARKVTTLVASIYFYGHHLNGVQLSGLFVCIGSMLMNFMGKGGKKGGHGHGGGGGDPVEEKNHSEERERFIVDDSHRQDSSSTEGDGDVELGPTNPNMTLV